MSSFYNREDEKSVSKRSFRHVGKSEEDASTEFTLDGSVDYRGEPARRATTGSWKSASFVFAQQFWGTLGFNGVGKNLVLYMTQVMHQGNAEASNAVSNWSGTVYVTPLLGAYLADSVWGRYWATVNFSIIFLVGILMIAIANFVDSLTPPQCPRQDATCEHATLVQNVYFYIALYLTAIGAGGYSPAIALGGDQFDEEDKRESIAKSSFFNWFYQSLTVGYVLAVTVLLYIQQKSGWGWGYTTAAMSALASTAVTLIGYKYFRHQKVGANPMTRVVQVFVASCRNWNLRMPPADELHEIQDNESNMTKRITHTPQFRYLDKAAIETAEGIKDEKMNPWRLCTVTQVEEVKCLVRLIPIFLTSILYTTVYQQLSTLFVVQGASMDTRINSFKLSPASLSAFEGISIIICVILYDQLFVPFMRKITGNPKGITDLQRIGTGLAISVAAMVISALVEVKRLNAVHEHHLLDSPSDMIPMSVFWEVPQYFVMGASEVFTYIGLLEFFYDQSPQALRSLGSSLSLLSNAAGSYLSTVLVMLVNNITQHQTETKLGWIPDININRGRFDLFFFLLAFLSAINFVAYVICAVRYKSSPPPKHTSSLSESTGKALANVSQKLN